MKNKLRPIEKKVIYTYAVLFAIILLCAIYFRFTITIYQETGWVNLILIKSLYFTLPAAFLTTIYFSSLIVIPRNEKSSIKKEKRGLIIAFLFATFINFFTISAIVGTAAKFYNIYGPNQQNILTEGTITKVYTKNKLRKKNNRKYYVTIYVANLQKEIKFETRKPYIENEFFSETLTLGSLGFLYKK